MPCLSAALRTFVWVVLAVLLAGTTFEAIAWADDGPGSGNCNVFTNTCNVGTGGGGNNGGGAGGGNNGGGGNTGCQNTDPHGGCNPCPPNSYYGERPPQVSQVCADYLANSYCNAMLGDMLGGLKWPAPNQLSVQQITFVNQQLASSGCPALVTPASLAQQAFASIHLPSPSGDRQPRPDVLWHGTPFTYTNIWTWYWTDASTWKPLSATASAAGLSATVTATPVELDFDPGDGSPAVSCGGPGVAWSASAGFAAPSSVGGCGYQYRKVTSAPIATTQTIVWAITWQGTGTTGGAIPSLSTSTSGQIQVLQIETVTH